MFMAIVTGLSGLIIGGASLYGAHLLEKTINDPSSLLNMIINTLPSLYNLIKMTGIFLVKLTTIIPTPFRSVILLFLMINILIISWRLIRR